MISSSGMNVLGETSTKRGRTSLGTLTRAYTSWSRSGSCSRTIRLSDRFEMYGNGRPGPMASGVRTGKICSRKWRSISSAGAVDSSQVTIRIPCSASAGRTTSENCRAWRRSSSVTRSAMPASTCGGRQAVRAPRVDPSVDLVVHAGHPHHEELVQVGDEDGQELHALHQRERLVLGQLEHAIVEVEPGELAVRRRARKSVRSATALREAERPSSYSRRGGVDRRVAHVTGTFALAIALSSEGRRSATSSPLEMPARPPFFILA